MPHEAPLGLRSMNFCMSCNGSLGQANCLTGVFASERCPCSHVFSFICLGTLWGHDLRGHLCALQFRIFHNEFHNAIRSLTPGGKGSFQDAEGKGFPLVTGFQRCGDWQRQWPELPVLIRCDLTMMQQTRPGQVLDTHPLLTKMWRQLLTSQSAWAAQWRPSEYLDYQFLLPCPKLTLLTDKPIYKTYVWDLHLG